MTHLISELERGTNTLHNHKIDDNNNSSTKSASMRPKCLPITTVSEMIDLVIMCVGHK